MKKIVKIIIILLSFSLIYAQGTKNKKIKNDVKFTNDELKEEYMRILDRSINLLQTNYVDSIDISEIILSGIKGAMMPLDPYTKLLMKENKDSYDELKTGKYGGIGISIGLRRDTLTVLGTFEDSPAYSEGIQIGDNIMMIDSTTTLRTHLERQS